MIERFRRQAVIHYDEPGPYRPDNLRDHRDVKHFYEDPTPEEPT